MVRIKAGTKLRYRCHCLSYTFGPGCMKRPKEGYHDEDVTYLGRAGRGRWKDFKFSEIIVQKASGEMCGIDLNQVIATYL